MADSFFIVESGEVKITMKRKVSVHYVLRNPHTISKKEDILSDVETQVKFYFS